MAKEDRHILEEIACDMVYLSMEHIGTEYAEIHEAVTHMSDAELIDFITQ